MILQNSIKNIINNSNNKNPLFTRNLIKEELQNYLLYFIYTNKIYNKFIFTGGTCLRKVYGLNRLSEDIDLDYTAELNINDFAQNTIKYFISTVQYPNITYSISGNKNTVFFKLPILKELNIYTNRTPEDIFVRCDFSQESKGGFTLDKNMITAGSFQFFVNSYDLSTMFANKIVAFLERLFYKGKLQKIPFKGRDIYDLYWMIQLSAKSSYQLKPNTERLKILLNNQNLDNIKNNICQKVKLLEPKFVYEDLFPLLESKDILDTFINSYQDYILKYIDFII